MKYLFASLIFLFSSVALAAQGYVVHIKGGCDYYIVSTNNGFALLQWFGGSIPNKGDYLIGDFESYGMKEVYNKTSNSETKVWVDNYWLGKDRVIEKYYDKCN